MALFDMLRRRPIRDLASLGVFIDEQSSLFAQRIVQDYLRMRAGPDAQTLFAEPAFRAALEKARWEAYPLSLAMVAELVEAHLGSRAADKQEVVIGGLERLVLGLFDRKPVPQLPGEAAWQAARADISRSLTDLLRHAPKTADDISESFAGLFLALMPLHEKLSGDDFPALRNALKLMLGEIREKFTKRAHPGTLIAQLAQSPG